MSIETKEERPLNQLNIGESAVVVGVENSRSELVQKLVSMGLVAGTKISVTQKGMFGSPINIKLLGSTLSLRGTEASKIVVAAA